MVWSLLAGGMTDGCAVQAPPELSGWTRRQPPMPRQQRSPLLSSSSTPPTPPPALPPPQPARPLAAPTALRPRRAAARRLPPTGPPMQRPAAMQSAMRSQALARPVPRPDLRRQGDRRPRTQSPRRPRRRARSWSRPQTAARRTKRRRGRARHAGRRVVCVPGSPFRAPTQPVPHRAWPRQPPLRRSRRAASPEPAARARARCWGRMSTSPGGYLCDRGAAIVQRLCRGRGGSPRLKVCRRAGRAAGPAAGLPVARARRGLLRGRGGRDAGRDGAARPRPPAAPAAARGGRAGVRGRRCARAGATSPHWGLPAGSDRTKRGASGNPLCCRALLGALRPPDGVRVLSAAGARHQQELRRRAEAGTEVPGWRARSGRARTPAQGKGGRRRLHSEIRVRLGVKGRHLHLRGASAARAQRSARRRSWRSAWRAAGARAWLRATRWRPPCSGSGCGALPPLHPRMPATEHRAQPATWSFGQRWSGACGWSHGPPCPARETVCARQGQRARRCAAGLARLSCAPACRWQRRSTTGSRSRSCSSTTTSAGRRGSALTCLVGLSALGSLLLLTCESARAVPSCARCWHASKVMRSASGGCAACGCSVRGRGCCGSVTRPGPVIASACRRGGRAGFVRRGSLRHRRRACLGRAARRAARGEGAGCRGHRADAGQSSGWSGRPAGWQGPSVPRSAAHGGAGGAARSARSCLWPRSTCSSTSG